MRASAFDERELEKGRRGGKRREMISRKFGRRCGGVVGGKVVVVEGWLRCRLSGVREQKQKYVKSVIGRRGSCLGVEDEVVGG